MSGRWTGWRRSLALLALLLVAMAAWSAYALTAIRSTWAAGRAVAGGSGPLADVAVVLGARAWGSVPSPGLAERLDAAAALLRTGRVQHLIVTGGIDAGGVLSEAAVSARYLMERHQVRRDALALEDTSTSTATNLANARGIMAARGWRTAAVVTHGYHLHRALVLARAAGLAAVGVAAETRVLYLPYHIGREVLALTLAHGEQVLGVGGAMASGGQVIRVGGALAPESGGDPLSESRWLLWGAGLAAGLVALLLLVGVLSPSPAGAGLYRYFDPAFVARAQAYNRARYLIFFLGQVPAVGLLVWMVWRGWDQGLGRWAGGVVGAQPILAAMLVGAVLSLALVAVELPAGIARFIVDHRHGLSTQSVGLWISDLLKGTAISLVIGAPLLAGLFWLIRKWPEGWWLPAAVGFALYLVASSLLGPVVIDPLFHRFTPLQDQGLAQEVRAMARRAGLPVENVLVMDASRRTRRVNAYFAGFGRTRRIVLYDTLLQSYDRRQVLLVLAHELGHWRLNHIYQGIALGAVGAALGFWLAQRLLAGSGGRPGEPAQVVVLMLFFTLVSFASQPVYNVISRAMERQADRFAMNLTGDANGMISLDVSLARSNLADVTPHPFTVAVLFTHPPALERIQNAVQAVP